MDARCRPLIRDPATCPLHLAESTGLIVASLGAVNRQFQESSFPVSRCPRPTEQSSHPGQEEATGRYSRSPPIAQKLGVIIAISTLSGFTPRSEAIASLWDSNPCSWSSERITFTRNHEGASCQPSSGDALAAPVNGSQLAWCTSLNVIMHNLCFAVV